MSSHAAELAHRLARNAEAVCRHYLSNGRREGRYWIVGDVRNTPGRSLFVRLCGPAFGKGAAGKWTDAATGEHGDLLDLIALNRGLDRLGGVARRGTRVPEPATTGTGARRADRWAPAPAGSQESARRLFAMSQPIAGTLAETYLRRRDIAALPGTGSSASIHAATTARIAYSPTETWPALIAAVTDLDGRITGTHRTWLDPIRRRQGADRYAATGDGPSPRAWRSLRRRERRSGRGRRHRDHAVAAHGVAVHANGRRALRQSPRRHPVPAGAKTPLHCTRRRSRQGCGNGSSAPSEPASAGIDAIVLSPRLGDFNEDLRLLGVDALRAALRIAARAGRRGPLHVVNEARAD